MVKQDTKEKLIQAGLKTLLEKGFNGVGVQEITEVAGVPKGSFYNHFESKDALGVEIVERYGMGSTRRAVLIDKTVSPLERLRTHFAALNDMFIASNPAWARKFTEAVPVAPFETVEFWPANTMGKLLRMSSTRVRLVDEI